MGMMKAEIPPEITGFKEKLFFGLTVRQLICAAGGLAVAIPTGLFGSKIMSSDMVQWAVVIEVIPFIAMGWLRYNDMPCEKIAKKILSYYFGNQKRKFKYTPPIVEIQTELRDIAFRCDEEERKNSRKKRK